MTAATSGGNFKRFISGFMALLMIFMIIPFTASNALGKEPEYKYYSDDSTINGWRNYFGTNVPNTSNVGHIWTDKSVLTSVPEEFKNAGIDIGSDEFLISLSALTSNKEVEGHSTLPTDTMLVLDLSGSMVNARLIDDLILAANSALTSLLAINKHNRVGVVVYSYEVATLLPLARYDSTATGYDENGNLIKIFIEQSGDANVHTKTGVFYEDSGDPVAYAWGPQKGGTYIQGGVLAACDQFKRDEILPYIPDGEIQAGTTRTPVFVLMSDGAPTYATAYYATSSTPHTYGDGENELNAGIAFLTQLSNSFAYNEVWDKYGKTPLFYSLGLGVDDSPYAMSVLDPTGSVSQINTYWDQFIAPLGSNALDDVDAWSANMSINVLNHYSTTTSDITIQRRHPGIYVSGYGENEIWLKDYVTKYYSASDADGLIQSFKNITEEIKVQSRYYPTAVGLGTSPNLDGYIRFTDELGEYIEVKEIKGVLLGDTLYNGASFASNLNNSNGGLGTITNPTDLGNEFVWSVQERLGLDLATARALIGNAYRSGQLSYTSSTEFSNFIGWYADENGDYVAPWSEGSSAPSNAKSIVRSYMFLGKTYGSIQDSDMMYASVRVSGDIATGIQTVSFYVPAALVPIVTYKINVSGSDYSTATATMEIIEEEPIRLIYSVGGSEAINAENIAETMANDSEGHLTDDGRYVFWTNAWGEDKSAIVKYAPSAQNEFYYFNEDVDVLWYNDAEGAYSRVYNVPELTSPDYYYGKHVFALTGNGNEASINTVYTRIDDQVIQSGIASSDKYDENAWSNYWYIPAGAAHHETDADDILDITKGENVSGTHEYVQHVISANASGVSTGLGNNGVLYATTYGNLVITKEVVHSYNGTQTLPEDLSFDVEVALTGPHANGTYSVSGVDGVTSVTTDANGKFTLSVKNGGSVCVYGIHNDTEYTVKEINIPADFAFSQQSSGLSGVISDHENATAAIINNYTPISVNVVKSISSESGRTFKEGEAFTFVLREIGGNEIGGNEIATATATAVGGETVLSASMSMFGVVYTEVGEYDYEIVEVDDGKVLGMTYDSQPNTFHVSVTEDGNGNLKSTVTAGSRASVSGDSAKGWTVSANFTNAYKATVPAQVIIDITKTVEVPSGATYPKNGFRFAVCNQDGSVFNNAQAVSDSNGAATIVLGFDADDIGSEFDLVLKEIDTGIAGMTYDDTEYKLNIKVIDKNNGTMAVVVNGVEGTAVDGINTYNYSATFNNSFDSEVASAVISGNKVFTGRDIKDTDIFSFVLNDSEGNEVETVTNPGGGFVFKTLEFDSVGEYVYTVTEVKGNINGVTYDTTVYDVVITVTDGGNGVLIASTEISVDGETVSDIEFINTYNPAPTTATVEGNKTLTGRDVLSTDNFSFELKDSEGNVIETVEVANGDFAFTALDFDVAGVYNYTVSEIKGIIGGVTYDETVYEVIITVTDDLDGSLVADVKYFNGDEEADKANFVNEYKAAPATATVEGNKTFTGRDALSTDNFSFELKDSEGNVIETVEVANGDFAFTALDFDAAGVYFYTVSEIKGTIGGVDYDETVYTVEITVTDDLEGSLVADVKYFNGDEGTDKANFVNEYKAAPVTAIINGLKVLEGRDLNEGEFSFTLTDENNVTETVTNNANGEFAFAEKEYTSVGEYVYTVAENSGELGGVIYDESVYTVTVTVTDDLNGNLVATVEYAKENQTFSKAIFTNKYGAGVTSVVFDGVKTLNGRELLENEFEFVLKDSEGNVIESKFNSADGTFAFTAIEFYQVGEYSYTVSEIDGNIIGVTYDETVYNVVITVTDDLNGKLVAEVVIADEKGNEVDDIAFENSYAPVEIDVNIEIEKIVENLTETEIGLNGFNFVIESEGKEIGKATSNKNGYAVFTLNFTDADLGKTFTYKVSEVNDGMAGMTYSEAVYEFVVKVVADENGELAAVVTMNGSSDETVAEFVNTYVGIPDTGDSTNTLIWVVMLVICGGAVINMFKRTNKEQEI